MGSKGGSPPPPPVAPDQSGDQMQQMMQMMMMMSMFGGGAGAAPPPPVIPSTPAITRTPLIDFREKQDQLASRAAADFQSDADDRKGRTDTSHSSPLLDEDDPITTASLLADPAVTTVLS